MNKTLLLIDLQNDYFPGGQMELHGIDAAAEKASLLLHHFRGKNMPVIHIQHFSVRPGAKFFIPGTDGAVINEKIAPLVSELVIRKNFPNSFLETSLAEELTRLKTEHIVVCGAMTHMCIDSTIRAAFDRGLTCTVAADACATRDLKSPEGNIVRADDVHQAFLAALSSVFASVVSTKEILND